MITLIRNPDGTLKTFAERGDDLSLAPGETLELSPLTFAQFAARLRLRVDGRGGETVRVPAGSPEVTVEVLCTTGETVSIAVNGLTEDVALTGGRGKI
jgi:F420-0:gamma-glutamyl ligase-like protein